VFGLDQSRCDIPRFKALVFNAVERRNFKLLVMSNDPSRTVQVMLIKSGTGYTDILFSIIVKIGAFGRANAQDKLPLLKRYEADGSMSLRSIADIFNRYVVKTVAGRRSWSASFFRRLKAIAK
jgi:hypothetical protein